jgi:hypothetical protein
MPEPGRGEMNFRADAEIYVRIIARCWRADAARVTSSRMH